MKPLSPSWPATASTATRCSTTASPGYAQSPRISAVVHAVGGPRASAPASPPPSASRPSSRATWTCARRCRASTARSVLTQGNDTLRAGAADRLRAGLPRRAGRAGPRRGTWRRTGTWCSDLIVLSAVNPLPADQAYDAPSRLVPAGPLALRERPGHLHRARRRAGRQRGAPLAGLDVRASAALQSGDQLGRWRALRPVHPGAGGQALRRLHLPHAGRPRPVGVDVAYTSSTMWVEREPVAQRPDADRPTPRTRSPPTWWSTRGSATASSTTR